MKKRRPTTIKPPTPPTPPTTYPAAMSGPVAIDGILYYVCVTSYAAFLDWRSSPIGHTEINRALAQSRAVKIWFPRSDNLIATIERRNVGTIKMDNANIMDAEDE